MTHGARDSLGETRFAPTIRRRIPLFVLVWVIVAVEKSALGDSQTKIVRSAAVAVTLFFLVKLRQSTTLTEQGIAVWNLRTKLIPWTSIVAVDTPTILWTDLVRLRLADGEVVFLPAPTSAWLFRDRRFPVKVDMIRAWWHLHAGIPVTTAD